MKDLYEILGVDNTASAEEIKRAYRKIAMKNHPDKNPGNTEAEQVFKEAAEAYSLLSDSQKRAQYDQFGHAGVGMGGMGGSGGFQGHMSMDDIFSQFSDIFGGDIFGNQSGRSRARGVETLKISIPLTLEEIFEGTTKKIKIKRWEKSSTSSAVKCNTCNGSGEVRHVQKSMLEQYVQLQNQKFFCKIFSQKNLVYGVVLYTKIPWNF